MRKRMLAAILFALLLTGCQSVQLEKEVIVMGIDKTDMGVGITVQIPKTAQGEGDSGGQESAQKGASGYMVATAEGKDLPDAMSALLSSIPYSLSFAQLREIVIGEDIAWQDGLEALLWQLLRTPTLRPTAAVLVALGDARSFIQQQKPDFGMRMSKHVDTTMQNLALSGMAPDCPLALVVRYITTHRRDPLVALCAVNEKASETFHQENGNLRAGEIPRTGDNPAEVLGAAALCDGRLCDTLTGYEMQLISALSGGTPTLLLTIADDPLAIRVRGKAALRAAVAETLQLQIDVKIDVRKSALTDNLREEDEVGAEMRRMAADALQGDITALMTRLQQKCSDPLGFGSVVAKAFLYDDEYEQYDFRSRYPTAQMVVIVTP